MRDEVEWEVERRDGEHHADRKAANDGPVPFRALLPIEREDFSRHTDALFSGDAEGEDGAIDFGASGGDGLTCLRDHDAREVFALCGDGLRDAGKDLLAFVSGEFAGDLEGCGGAIECGVYLCVGVLVHAADDSSVIRRADLYFAHAFNLSAAVNG